MNVIGSVSPVQTSTNDYALVQGSILNATRALSVSYTIVNTGDNSITWQVMAGNASDLSDGIVTQAPAAVAADATGSYSVYPAPFKYYGVQIKSTSGGSHGEGSVRGAAKG